MNILLSAFEPSLASALCLMLKFVIPFCPRDRNLKQNLKMMKYKRTGKFTVKYQQLYEFSVTVSLT